MHLPERHSDAHLQAIGRAFALALLLLFVLLLEYAATRPRSRHTSTQRIATPGDPVMLHAIRYAHHRPLALLVLPLILWIGAGLATSDDRPAPESPAAVAIAKNG